MSSPKPPVRPGGRGFKLPEQRCCPTCLRVMRLVDGKLACEKHGTQTKR